MPTYEQDSETLQHFNKFKRKISQNRLLIISAVNLLTFALNGYQSKLQTYLNSQMNKARIIFGSIYSMVNSLISFNTKVSKHQDSNFVAQEMQLVRHCLYNLDLWVIIVIDLGFLCFFMFMVSYILQLRDFYQVVQYLRAANVHSRDSIRYKSSLQAKDSFIHLVTIMSYSIGLGLNFFSLTLMNLTDYHYGISFWMFFSSLIVFILCIIYKNISIRRIAQQSLMLNLIEGEKNLRKEELIENSKSEAESSEFQI